MNTKQLYTAPEADLLVVRFEENIMSAKLNGGSKVLFLDEVATIEEGSSDIFW